MRVRVRAEGRTPRGASARQLLGMFLKTSTQPWACLPGPAHPSSMHHEQVHGNSAQRWQANGGR
eukprot:363736-Chlamydomonas_euryale.AAC.1